MLEFFLNFLFPKFCLNCGGGNDYLCEKCSTQVDFIKIEVCPVCERLSLYGETHYRCKTAEGIDGMTVGANYGNKIVQKLIHRFKYQGNYAVGDCLVEKFLKEKLLIFDNHRIVPKIDFLTFVPLHSDKERKRGFNQSEILAKRMGTILNLPVANLLKRMVYTDSQMSRKKEKERRENVRGIFEFVGMDIHGKNIAIVDDVATTGATLFECVKVLKRNGAKFVWGVVLARKQPQI